MNETSAEIAATTGTFSTAISYRGSAKYADPETGLIYFGYRYYQPNKGRWVSRDPLGERAFFQQYAGLYEPGQLPGEEPATSNSYLFINNNSVGHTDMDGCRQTPSGEVAITAENRRDAPGEMILIQVPKCTILFVYGHNYVNNFNKSGLQWIWNIVPAKDSEKQSSYAAVGSCSANLVPNEIPLPGFKYSDYDVGDEGTISGLKLLDMWRDVRNNYAPAAKQEICKKCDCKEVTLKWQKVGGGVLDLAPIEMKFPCK